MDNELGFFKFVVGSEFLKQRAVHLHKRLEDVVDQRQDCLIPVLLRDAEQRREHDRHHNRLVLLDQAREVLVVPQKQRPLRHLQTPPRPVSF